MWSQWACECAHADARAGSPPLPSWRGEEELAEFFVNATVGMHWVWPDGTVLRVNRAELEMLGYSGEEYLARHIAEFHADKDAIRDILARLNAGGAGRGQPADEYRQVHRAERPHLGGRRSGGRGVVLRVRDNGIGIAPEVLPRVFDLVVQADHASNKAQGGLGMA